MLRKIFVGPIGLRSGWRLVLWFLVAGALEAGTVFALFVATGTRPAPHEQIPWRIGLPAAAIGILPAVLLTWLFEKFLDHGGFANVGLALPPSRAIRESLLGFGTGAAILTAGLLIVALGGGVTISGRVATDTAPAIALAVVGLVLAAAKEELWFRGATFQPMVRAIGAPKAIAVFALLFGAMHMGNHGATALGVAEVMAAGVLLSFALLARKNLYFPMGLHAGWNVTQGLILGIAVSGNAGFPSIFHTTITGADWWSGGAFGLEGSTGGLIATILGCVAIGWPLFRRAPTAPPAPPPPAATS